ncbi:hypothetical protein ACFL1M_04435 [Patescibacteria group bacterium]
MDQEEAQTQKKELIIPEIKDKWYDVIYKKIPAGKKLDPKLLMYVGFGSLVFVGAIASTLTPKPKKSAP